MVWYRKTLTLFEKSDILNEAERFITYIFAIEANININNETAAAETIMRIEQQQQHQSPRRTYRRAAEKNYGIRHLTCVVRCLL